MSKFLSTQFLRQQAPIEDDPVDDRDHLAQRAVEGHDRHPRDKALVPSDRVGE